MKNFDGRLERFKKCYSQFGARIFENAPIGFLSSLLAEWEQTTSATTAPARIVHLKRNAVIRLEKNSGVKRVEIKNGAIWLTGTPASGDVLLDRGGRFEMADQWPYVIQALEPGEIVLSIRPPPT